MGRGVEGRPQAHEAGRPGNSQAIGANRGHEFSLRRMRASPDKMLSAAVGVENKLSTMRRSASNFQRELREFLVNRVGDVGMMNGGGGGGGESRRGVQQVECGWA